MCLSLAEAHDAGLIHRDVKPANIFLCRQATELDITKMLDFGLITEVARTHRDDAAALTRDNDVVGTPAFIAPEMIVAPDEVDHRADIYALGCVAYFLLTGRHVFEEKTVVGLLSCHVHKAPPSPLFDETAVPEALEALVTRMLAKSPADRPQSAGEVLTASVALNLPLPLGDSTVLAPGIGYCLDKLSFSHESPAERELELHAFELPITLIHLLSSDWMLLFQAKPGLAGDLASVQSRAFHAQGLGLAAYQLSDELALGGGGAAMFEFGSFLPLPVLYAQWEPTKHVTVEALLPLQAEAKLGLGEADEAQCVDHVAYSVATAGATLAPAPRRRVASAHITRDRDHPHAVLATVRESRT